MLELKDASLRYLTNDHGQRTAVVIDLETWHQIIESLDDLEDAEELRLARDEDDEVAPWPQVAEEYQAEREESAAGFLEREQELLSLVLMRQLQLRRFLVFDLFFRWL